MRFAREFADYVALNSRDVMAAKKKHGPQPIHKRTTPGTQTERIAIGAANKIELLNNNNNNPF